MSRPLVDPDLAAITAAFVGAGAAFVVIGCFAVIANDYVRATEDVERPRCAKAARSPAC